MNIAYRIRRYCRSRDSRKYRITLAKLQPGVTFYSTERASIWSSRLFVIAYIAIAFGIGYTAALMLKQPDIILVEAPAKITKPVADAATCFMGWLANPGAKP